jgi:hypothetical protein
MKRKTRFFIHVGGFKDGTLFIMYRSRRFATLVSKEGVMKDISGIPLAGAVEAVAEGHWVELNKSHVIYLCGRNNLDITL